MSRPVWTGLSQHRIMLRACYGHNTRTVHCSRLLEGEFRVSESPAAGLLVGSPVDMTPAKHARPD